MPVVKACKSFAEHVKPWLDKCSGKFCIQCTVPAPPLPNKESRLSPATFLVTLCTAVRTSLSTVLTHPLPAPGEDGEDTGTAAHSSLPRGPDVRYARGKLRHVSACPRAREEGISEQGESKPQTHFLCTSPGLSLGYPATPQWHHTDASQHCAVVGQLWQLNILQRS